MHVISAEPVIWRLSFQLSRHSCQDRRPFLLHIWIQKSAPVYLSRSEALVLTSFLRASSWSRTSKRLWLQIPVRWVYVAMSRQCRRLYGHYRFLCIWRIGNLLVLQCMTIIKYDSSKQASKTALNWILMHIIIWRRISGGSFWSAELPQVSFFHFRTI